MGYFFGIATTADSRALPVFVLSPKRHFSNLGSMNYITPELLVPLILLFNTSFMGLKNSTPEELITVVLPYVVAVLVPTGPYILTVGFFVVGDLVTGIIASSRKHEPFTSKRLRESVGKFIAYGIFILVASAIQRQFIGDDFPCVKLVAMFIAYIELKSIDENAKVITGHSIFSKIIQLLNPKKNEQNNH